MMRTTTFTLLVLFAAMPALAGDLAYSREGWQLGLDVGLGGGHVEYERSGQAFETDDDTPGSTVGMRVGYGFSESFALSLELRGWGRERDAYETNVGSSLLLATFYPGGSGFFLYGGLGAARIETTVPETGADPDAVAFEKNGAMIALGLGYEWRLSRSFALALAVDARGGAVEDFGDLKDVNFGHSTLGFHFNWYL